MSAQLPAALSRLVDAQRGVVNRQQALRAGLTADAVQARVRRGTWRQIFRGVYFAADGPISREARLWAAVLYCGKGAVLSHETAAELHGLDARPSSVIHVSIPSSRRVVAAQGIRVHLTGRPLELLDGHRDPPHTEICETLLDLADAADNLDTVCGWLTDAFSKERLHAVRFLSALSVRSRARWRLQLNEMVSCAASGDHSVLEYRYTRDVERAHGLPEAIRQVVFRKADGSAGRRDRIYPDYDVIVELDGLLAHPPQQGWADKERDSAAAAEGKITLRYGWRHVDGRACVVAAQVGQVLRHRGWTGSLRPCFPGCEAPFIT